MGMTERPFFWRRWDRMGSFDYVECLAFLRNKITSACETGTKEEKMDKGT